MSEQKKLTDSIRNALFHPVGIGILVLVMLSQVLIVIHTEPQKSLVRTNVTLKPLQLDRNKFDKQVLKPHNEMKKKFANHPEMVLKKLIIQIDKEGDKTMQLKEKMSRFKQSFGLSDNDIAITRKILGRRRRSPDPEELPVCPMDSPLLLGQLTIQLDSINDSNPDSDAFRSWFGDSLRKGGTYRPPDCIARQKVAIIVPYRNRETQLEIFLHHLHPILQRQQLDYRIVVVEQTADEEFNRAALMNIGFVEAMSIDKFDCFVFHDVDLLPEDDRNIYECPEGQAKHMSVAVNKWKYRLQYLNYFGGVTALSRDQFVKINGFANSFYGWGGEDDDLHHRIEKQNYKVYRSPANIARFFMLHHGKVNMNEDLSKMMEMSKKDLLKDDGLSTLEYSKVEQKELPLYTWILAKLPPAPSKESSNWINGIGHSLWNGMSYAADGLAKKVSDTAVEMAAKNEEKEETKRNHIY